jgi:hypothetical protein
LRRGSDVQEYLFESVVLLDVQKLQVVQSDVKRKGLYCDTKPNCIISVAFLFFLFEARACGAID